MKMLDKDSNEPVRRAVLLLTVEEASDLRLALDRLLVAKPVDCQHAHIYSDDYQEEFSIALYGDAYTSFLQERLQVLINDN